jgi:hypothetical protein
MVGATRFLFFSNLSKTGSTLKIQNGSLILLQKFPIFACGSPGILWTIFLLCWHPFPNINRAKNPGSDSTFESLMNLKGGLNLPKKSGKFLKIPSWSYLHKSEFSWDHLYARMWVTIQVPNDGVWIK